MSAFSDYMEGLASDVPGRSVLADIAGAVDALRDEAEDVAEAAGGTGITSDIAGALLDCFAHLVYTDAHGQDYYDALEAALDTGELRRDLMPTIDDYLSAMQTDVHGREMREDILGALTLLKEVVDSASAGGLTDGIKSALLQCFAHAAWTSEDGQQYYNALEEALYPPAGLASISVVYNQSGTVYDTDTLDSLRPDLTVTAHYDDGTSETVTAYTLSGTLTAGTSTITAAYGGQTATFSVTVTEYTIPALYDWDFTQSLTDSVGGVTAQIANVTQDSEGLHFLSSNSCCLLGANVFEPGHTLEVDFSSTDASLGGNHGRLIMFNDTSSPAPETNVGNGFIYRSTGAWAFYKSSWSSNSAVTDADAFDGHTLVVKYYYSSDDDKYHTDVYCDNTPVMDYAGGKWNNSINPVQIGSGGNAFKNMVVTGARIYEGV